MFGRVASWPPFHQLRFLLKSTECFWERDFFSYILLLVVGWKASNDFRLRRWRENINWQKKISEIIFGRLTRLSAKHYSVEKQKDGVERDVSIQEKNSSIYVASIIHDNPKSWQLLMRNQQIKECQDISLVCECCPGRNNPARKGAICA